MFYWPDFKGIAAAGEAGEGEVGPETLVLVEGPSRIPVSSDKRSGRW